MGGGAAVAAIAAVRARQIREVLDAYRIATATSPEHARIPGELGLGDHERILHDLVSEGVLVEGARPGAYYLSERGYITYRDRSDSRRKIAVLVVLLLAVVMAGVATYMASAVRQ